MKRLYLVEEGATIFIWPSSTNLIFSGIHLLLRRNLMLMTDPNRVEIVKINSDVSALPRFIEHVQTAGKVKDKLPS